MVNVGTSENGFLWPRVSAHKYPFTALKRIIGYSLRFAHNVKNKQKRIGWLTCAELNNAELHLIKSIQNELFSDEIKTLRKNKQVKKSSVLFSLSPFLDDNELIRVGGRLNRADIPFDAKHQILMPNKHPITLHLIKEKHEECMHGGAKLTETVLRQKYWVPQCKRTIKTILKNCADCVHVNPKPMVQYMGDLPSVRVTACKKPFTDSAVDYTGAVQVKVSNGRGQKTHKAYIAIFVCMATKAIHIEAVNDLTADAFIAAYRQNLYRRCAKFI